MKLTELKKKIDAALKLHDDYDVRIIAKSFADSHILDLDEAGIDRGRFNFDLYINVVDLLDSICE